MRPDELLHPVLGRDLVSVAHVLDDLERPSGRLKLDPGKLVACVDPRRKRLGIGDHQPRKNPPLRPPGAGIPGQRGAAIADPYRPRASTEASPSSAGSATLCLSPARVALQPPGDVLDHRLASAGRVAGGDLVDQLL